TLRRQTRRNLSLSPALQFTSNGTIRTSPYNLVIPPFGDAAPNIHFEYSSIRPIRRRSFKCIEFMSSLMGHLYCLTTSLCCPLPFTFIINCTNELSAIFVYKSIIVGIPVKQRASYSH